MNRIITLIAVILLCFVARAGNGGGNGDDIKSKQSELARLRQEIQQYEDKIKEHEKKESSTLDLIDTYDRQINLVRKVVKNLHEQEVQLQQGIDKTRAQIRDLGGQLTFLKRQYAGYIEGMYKFGRSYDLELLLSARSLNQALIRSEYLRRFSDQRKHDVDRIVTKREDAEEMNLQLQKQLSEQRQLLADKADEEKSLASKMSKRQTMLADIRRDKKALKREVSRTVAQAQDLEGLITKLIEEDRIRKEREAAKARDAAKAREKNGVVAPPLPTPEPSYTGKPFNTRRGHLRWPASQGKVVAHFGPQKHPILGTITQNTGIDISLPVGSNVTSTSEGEVSAISWLPSFGNLVIVDHSNGYRTVYAHLSEITVAEGQHIAEGGSLGRSGEALTGPLLHFEIWKDREKQDPENWLAPHGLARK